MRIISDFHDYYDGVQTFGQDRALVYLRKRRELDDAERRSLFPSEPTAALEIREEARGSLANRRRVACRAFWLAVAGKVYRGYRMRRLEGHPSALREEVCAYDYEALLDCGQRWGFDLRERKCRYRWQRSEGFRPWLRAQGTDELSSVLAANEVVIAGALQGWANRRPRPLVLNPRLADFQFGKLMGAAEVFQELEMWIGGVLPRKNAMTSAVSDADRFVERGFDARTSFRRAKVEG